MKNFLYTASREYIFAPPSLLRIARSISSLFAALKDPVSFNAIAVLSQYSRNICSPFPFGSFSGKKHNSLSASTCLFVFPQCRSKNAPYAPLTASGFNTKHPKITTALLVTTATSACSQVANRNTLLTFSCSLFEPTRPINTNAFNERYDANE